MKNTFFFTITLPNGVFCELYVDSAAGQKQNYCGTRNTANFLEFFFAVLDSMDK